MPGDLEYARRRVLGSRARRPGTSDARGVCGRAGAAPRHAAVEGESRESRQPGAARALARDPALQQRRAFPAARVGAAAAHGVGSDARSAPRPGHAAARGGAAGNGTGAGVSRTGGAALPDLTGEQERT
ncbi:hypothetical protein PT2222_280042 [Paraburkholderia tropica]